MRIAALIEIAPTADGALPLELIARAYRASGRAPVVLVVADELRDRVERAIDPLVPQMPRDIPGVRYIRAADAVAVAHWASLADEVLLTSASLQSCIGGEWRVRYSGPTYLPGIAAAAPTA